MTRLNQFDVEKIQELVSMYLDNKYRAFFKDNFIFKVQLCTQLSRALQKQLEREMQDEDEGLVYIPTNLRIISTHDALSVLCLIREPTKRGKTIAKGATTQFKMNLPANLAFEFQKLEKMKEYL